MHYIVYVATIVSICWYFFRQNRKRQLLNKFTEPPGHFLFGHVLKIRSTTTLISTSKKFLKDHGTTLKLNVGPLFSVLLTCDYKLIEYVLKHPGEFKKSDNYEFLKPWLGSGLLTSESDSWKRNRKMLTPAFHFEILKQFVPVFESVGKIFVDKLGKCQSASVDLQPLVSLCTLDVISETAMGTKINALNGENSEYVRSVKEMCRIVTDRCLSVLKLNDWSFVLTRDYYLQKSLLKLLHGFTSDVITRRKETMEDKDYYETKKKMAFLDLLLNIRKQDGCFLSDEEIRQEVDTFLFAGHDTTSSGICFTLFCLAQHPEIQEKVLQEQKDLFGEDKDPLVTYQELQSMKYLELVIKETFRLYPPVPVIGRITRTDMEFDNRVIPKGVNLVLFIYSLHRNPEYFPEPERFDPNRFERYDGSLPYAYIPFSAGSRNCIGQKFAMLELKSVVSTVVRHFELKAAEPHHDLVLEAAAVLTSASGINVGLKKRI